MGFFDKFKNDSGISIQKAAELVASMICDIGITGGEFLSKEFCNFDIENLQDNDETMLWEIIIEYEFLFLALVGKIASSSLDKKSCRKFIDLLLEYVGVLTFDTALLGSKNVKVEKLMSEYLDRLMKRMDHYDKCNKVLFDGDGFREGTMFWEFGKIISFILNDSENIKIVKVCIVSVIKS